MRCCGFSYWSFIPCFVIIFTNTLFSVFAFLWGSHRKRTPGMLITFWHLSLFHFGLHYLSEGQWFSWYDVTKFTKLKILNIWINSVQTIPLDYVNHCRLLVQIDIFKNNCFLSSMRYLRRSSKSKIIFSYSKKQYMLRQTRRKRHLISSPPPQKNGLFFLGGGGWFFWNIFMNFWV